MDIIDLLFKVGFIFFDLAVRQSVRSKKALLLHYKDSMASENIRQIARRIDKYWTRPFEKSALLLAKHAQKTYNAAGTKTQEKCNGGSKSPTSLLQQTFHISKS